MVKPAVKREIVRHLTTKHQASERRACHVTGISRRTFRYSPKKRDDKELMGWLSELSQRFPGYGFWKLFGRLPKGHGCNHKRVHRVYVQMGLNIQKKTKRRLPQRVKTPIETPSKPNTVWSMDFMHDGLYDGRKFRLLNIIDHYNRELVAIEIGQSLSAERVVRVLKRLHQEGRKPQTIRVDNGPEFIAKVFQKWAQDQGVSIDYIQPGKPTQNALIERLNKSCRQELLNPYLFDSLQEVEDKATQWQYEYNHFRTHDSLGKKSPLEYKTIAI